MAAQLGSDGTEYESLTTRFLKEANKVIELNAKSEKRDIENDDSLCAACGAVEPDVRLTSCECRALFCQECMLRCFMAKQKPEHMSTWLRVVQTQAIFIFEINVGKSRIRHITTMILNDEFLDRLQIN